MFYSNNRDDIRHMYFAAWEKVHKNQPLEPLEIQIVDVINEHPEYHQFLSDEDNRDKDFPVEDGQSNPFLHMGMHIAIKEQLSINQPAGITTEYKRLQLKNGDTHSAEHCMMECLAEMIWQAQHNQQPMDNNVYLSCLKKK